MSGQKYSQIEMMVAAASRLLEDKKIVAVGSGLPLLAALLAKRLHAPRLIIMFEAGGIDPRLPWVPISVGESMTYRDAVMAASMDYVMSLLQAGYVDYAMLGASQIDQYGNINTTVIGDWDRPKVRLPGSGGANDFGSLAWRTIVIMRQGRDRFVPKVDFVTTPGYIRGRGAREEAGLPSGTGPWRVVTQYGIYAFDEVAGRIKLIAVYPGVKLEEVRENSGFEIDVAEPLDVVEEPSDEELRAMRELDPGGVVLVRKVRR